MCFFAKLHDPFAPQCTLKFAKIFPHHLGIKRFKKKKPAVENTERRQIRDKGLSEYIHMPMKSLQSAMVSARGNNRNILEVEHKLINKVGS